MKKILLFTLFALIFTLSACQNIPQAPTKTPTMTNEEMMFAAQETFNAMAALTQTQYALDNPSPTPTDTATPTPEFTPTSPLPLIPPTATEAPLPYYSIKNKSSKVSKVGDPGNWGPFVPMDTLYIEVCYQNAGSGIWTENYRCMVTNHGGASIQPIEVALGKTVKNGEWACFSFQNYNPEQALGTHCPSFQMINENGQNVSNGNNSICWVIE